MIGKKGGSRRAWRKAAVRELIESRDLDRLGELAARERGVFQALSSLLAEESELLGWRAVEAIGRAAAVEKDTEKLRETIRRFLWLMNDESGGLLRRAPEAIGEMAAAAPSSSALIGDYGHLMVHFLREEPFERGAHWALARLSGIEPAIYAQEIPALLPSLVAPDPFIRAHAALALLRIGERGIVEESGAFDDKAPLRVYDFETGRMRSAAVAGLLGEERGRCFSG